MAELQKRRQELGPEGLARVQQEWAEVIADAREAFAAKKTIDDPEVVAIARRWKALVAQFTGGNEGIGDNLKRLWQDNPDGLAQKSGIAIEVARFMGKAMERLG
jgi:hypothetical protein